MHRLWLVSVVFMTTSSMSLKKLEQEKKELKKTIMSLEGAPDVVREI